MFDLNNLIQQKSSSTRGSGQGDDRGDHQPAQKRFRPEGVDLFQLIAQNLHAMRNDLKSKPISADPSKIEVEMRVGMITDGSRRWKSHKSTGGGVIPDERVSFKSGIDEILSEKIKNILKQTGFCFDVEPPQRVRLDHAGTLRCLVDVHGNVAGYIETKDKFLRCNIACLGHNYDMRIDIASEIEESRAPNAATHPVWHKERLKKRIKYRREQNGFRSYWMIDMTEVVTTDLTGLNIGKSVTSTELEFELLPSVLVEWLSFTDNDSCIRFTSELASELLKLFDLCIPSHGHSARSGEEMVRPLPQTSPLFSAITSLFARIRGSTNGPDFIGCMPLNISRRNLKTLQQLKYFITEKSDGTRFLLSVIPSSAISPSAPTTTGTAVLMDRAPTFKLPLGAAEIGRHLGIGTVLDGELVYNMTIKKEVFLIFDILSVDGEVCAHEPFERRLQIIKERIEPRLRSLFASPLPPSASSSSSSSSSAPPPPPPPPVLTLVRKLFWHKSEFKTLLDLIKYENGERIFKESYWRYHKTDGLIFQPNLPYTFGTDNNLIKWKWAELTSVDLNVILCRKGQRGEIELGLLCDGPDGSQIDIAKRGTTRLSFNEFDTYRIIADIEDSNKLINIAEVAYNPSHGVWVYFHLREDKTSPNFINTVLGVLMEQAEAISIEELEYRFLARNENENDFNSQIEKMTGKLMEFQRKRTQVPTAH
jgi:hypothetical protein